MTLFVIAAKAVQMMSLKHETARYSRKSRPNDASETSKADQMMPQKHHLDGYVKGLSRGQPWVCDWELSDPCSRDSTSQFYASCPALSPKRFPQLYIFTPSTGSATIFISIRTVERPDFLTFYFLKVLKNKIKVGLIWRYCKKGVGWGGWEVPDV